MNRADSVMRNDSLAEQLAEYFDRHGTPNERMRAHYILGRTYADMGEAPAAVNAYLDAADAADTTAADCDYRTLSRVYGQMSSVLYKQNLIEDYIKACDDAISCAWRAADTLQVLNVKAYKIAGYHRLKQYDTVITAFESLFDELERQFGIWMAAKYITIPISALLAKNQLEKCKYYFDVAERYSGYFDSVKNVEKGREVYYNYKGCYFLNTQQYDSAEHCFRKELSEGLDVTNQSMASRGLSLLYSETHRLDSAVKYALYSYEMNDSVYAQMATETVSQAQASYNYQRNKALAEKERHRAEYEKQRAERNLFLLFVIIIISSYTIYRLLALKRARDKAYQLKEQELERSFRDILILRSQAENLSQLIEEKESAISQSAEELEELRQSEKSLRQMIEEKEMAVDRLHAEVSVLSRHVHTNYIDNEVLLEESPLYSNLHKKVDAGRMLNDEDISQLYRLVRETLPGFYQFISNKKHALNEAEYNVCILFRLHVRAFGVSVLLDKSPASITKISKAVLEKLFQENGNSRELITKLMEIC